MQQLKKMTPKNSRFRTTSQIVAEIDYTGIVLCCNLQVEKPAISCGRQNVGQLFWCFIHAKYFSLRVFCLRNYSYACL